jgi:hypothetical protein
MGARITIIVASILFFVPSFVLLLFSYPSGGGQPQYLQFILQIPFMGTYPFAVWASDGKEIYQACWCVVIGLATAGLGIWGLLTGKPKYAAIFVGILIVCWALTLFRFVALNERVYN